MDHNAFNIEEFDIKLDTDLIGRQFIYIQQLDSTNSFLLNSKEFKTTGTVVLAEEQTNGRGRKGREWQSQPEHNLTLSILLRKIDGKKVNILNLGASLAVAQSIENLFQLKPALKWPNDVLISGRKVSGILLQSTSKGSDLDRVVIGMGINVNQSNFPGKYLIEPTSIRREFKHKVSRERLLSEILNQFEEIYNLVEENPNKVLDDWKERCKMIGEKVKIEGDGKIRYGIFEDIDDDGFLVLKIADKTEKVHFGDVSLS